jgi:hypothetical protein
MNPLEVLVIFYCRTGETESRALAAALGAVQGKATIRLRRLRDASDTPANTEPLARMCKEYVPPTEADLIRADALILSAGPDFTPDAAEWSSLFSLLARLGSEEKLRHKLALVVSPTTEGSGALTAVLQNAGLLVMAVAASDYTQQGRELAIHAQALKEARSGA